MATIPLLFSTEEQDLRHSAKKVAAEEDILEVEGLCQKVSVERNSSSFQATVNSLSLLFGIGLLSAPYALQNGGSLSLLILILFAVIFCYTAYILGRCLESDQNITTFQDIGAKAFGLKGRVFVTALLYIEIISVLVGYTISLGDNLSMIFPDVVLDNAWIHLSRFQFLACVASIIILPTVWLRSLGSLAFLSFSGLVTYSLLILCVVWAGVQDKIGFHQEIPTLRTQNITAVSGLYAYCYSGHAIFPTIYSSMKKPSSYPKVLVVSFTAVTVVYIGLAMMGALMFGDEIESQITLSLPKHLLVTKIALWVIVITPLSKFSMSIAPIALELEYLLPTTLPPRMRYALGMIFRTCIFCIILLIALALPFFGYILNLVGSALSITMSVIIPCTFYLRLHWSSLKPAEIVMNFLFIIVGLIFGVTGTIDSINSLIQS